MKKGFILSLILICIFVLSACADEPAEADQTTTNETTAVDLVHHKLAPLIFEVPDDSEASTAAEIQASMTATILQTKNEAHPHNAAYALDKVDYYYKPVYAEQWCDLTHIKFNGGADGNIVLVYHIPEPYQGRVLTLQFDRDAEYGKELFEHSITVSDAIPFEPCEGVYYTDVYNPGDNGELSLTQFFWVHDGYSFMMQVWPEVMEQILENDPNALKGALFELEKVMLETDSESDNVETE